MNCFSHISQLCYDGRIMAHYPGCSPAEKVVRQREWSPEKALLGAAAGAGSRPMPGDPRLRSPVGVPSPTKFWALSVD